MRDVPLSLNGAELPPAVRARRSIIESRVSGARGRQRAAFSLTLVDHLCISHRRAELPRFLPPRAFHWSHIFRSTNADLALSRLLFGQFAHSNQLWFVRQPMLCR